MIDLDTLCEGLPIHDFADGELVIAEGKRVDGLYFLKSGKVATFRGCELITTVDDFGLVVGEVSVLLERPALTSIRSVGSSSFYFTADAEAFLATRPELALHVARGLAKKLHCMGCYLTDLKQQYAQDGDHLSMVHEVLDSFLHTNKS